MTFKTIKVPTAGNDPYADYETKITYNGTNKLTVNSEDAAAFVSIGPPTTTVNLDTCDYQSQIQPEYTSSPKYRFSLKFNQKS